METGHSQTGRDAAAFHVDVLVLQVGHERALARTWTASDSSVFASLYVWRITVPSASTISVRRLMGIVGGGAGEHFGLEQRGGGAIARCEGGSGRERTPVRRGVVVGGEAALYAQRVALEIESTKAHLAALS